MCSLTVFLVPEDNYFISIRHVLGLVMILWLPGYSLIKLLFPSYSFLKTSIDDIERAALSIGTSLALVSIIGLILNYTPWGINLTSIVFCLFLVTTLFATTGIWRQYVSDKSYSQTS